jgi:hypothetical protein
VSTVLGAVAPSRRLAFSAADLERDDGWAEAMAAEGDGLELSTINPAGIFGPVLGADASSSIELVPHRPVAQPFRRSR